jgi:hypothetical protein
MSADRSEAKTLRIRQPQLFVPDGTIELKND